MTVDHFQCCFPLRVAIGLGDLRLHDQAVTVFHEGVPHEAEDGAGPAERMRRIAEEFEREIATPADVREFLGLKGEDRLNKIKVHKVWIAVDGGTIVQPDAARANRSIFYKAGRAATVGEVYANLTPWEHVNVEGENGKASLYLNGEHLGSLERPLPFTWDPAKSAMMIGLNYIGLMDELMVFDKPLSDSQVRWLYENLADTDILVK